jgi:hypothetical protein
MLIILLFRLLPIINAIADFVRSNGKNFDNYLSHIASEKAKMAGNPEKTPTLLKKKQERGRSALEDDIKEMNRKIREKEEKAGVKNETLSEGLVDEIEDFEEEQNKKKLIINKGSQAKNKIMLINDNDRKVFQVVDDVIQVLGSHFKEKNQDTILDTLKATSFNILNAYLALNNSETFKSNYIFINHNRLNIL